jgi:hypothetical protein
MHHSLNGTRLVSGLLRTNEVTVLTVGTLPPRQYTTIASRCLFLAESTGFQASGRSYENVFDTERGKRWIQVNYVPDFDAQGQVVGTVLLGFDVTERRQQEETLQAYSERLEERVQERTAALQEAQEQLVRREKLAVRIFRNMATSGFTNCPSHERLDGASGAICLQTQYACLRLSIVALPNALRAQALRLSADLPSP